MIYLTLNNHEILSQVTCFRSWNVFNLFYEICEKCTTKVFEYIIIERLQKFSVKFSKYLINHSFFWWLIEFSQ